MENLKNIEVYEEIMGCIKNYLMLKTIVQDLSLFSLFM